MKVSGSSGYLQHPLVRSSTNLTTQPRSVRTTTAPWFTNVVSPPFGDVLGTRAYSRTQSGTTSKFFRAHKASRIYRPEYPLQLQIYVKVVFKVTR